MDLFNEIIFENAKIVLLEYRMNFGVWVCEEISRLRVNPSRMNKEIIFNSEYGVCKLTIKFVNKSHIIRWAHMWAYSEFKERKSCIVMILSPSCSKISLGQKDRLKYWIQFYLVVDLKMINSHFNVLSLACWHRIDYKFSTFNRHKTNFFCFLGKNFIFRHLKISNKTYQKLVHVYLNDCLQICYQLILTINVVLIVSPF